jgi:hypothetical protein
MGKGHEDTTGSASSSRGRSETADGRCKPCHREKAQEAMTKISANTATGTAGTETASSRRGFIPPADGAVPEPSCVTPPT